MNIESSLLSKVIDSNSFYTMNRYNITEDDFFLQKDTYRFIKDYVDTYHECPSYTAVVAECKEFDYDPEVSDNIEYLCRKVKSDRAKRESFELLQNEATKKFSELPGDKFIQWLKGNTDRIYDTTQTVSSSGSNWATNGQERREMYLVFVVDCTEITLDYNVVHRTLQSTLLLPYQTLSTTYLYWYTLLTIHSLLQRNLLLILRLRIQTV